MKVRSVHSRELSAPTDRMSAPLDRLGSTRSRRTSSTAPSWQRPARPLAPPAAPPPCGS